MHLNWSWNSWVRMRPLMAGRTHAHSGILSPTRTTYWHSTLHTVIFNALHSLVEYLSFFYTSAAALSIEACYLLLSKKLPSIVKAVLGKKKGRPSLKKFVYPTDTKEPFFSLSVIFIYTAYCTYMYVFQVWELVNKTGWKSGHSVNIFLLIGLWSIRLLNWVMCVYVTLFGELKQSLVRSRNRQIIPWT